MSSHPWRFEVDLRTKESITGSTVRLQGSKLVQQHLELVVRSEPIKSTDRVSRCSVIAVEPVDRGGEV